MALDPRAFGRRDLLRAELALPGRLTADDLRLFAATFIAGFVFVSIFLA